MVKILRWFGVVIVILLGIMLMGCSLALFASLGDTAPLWLRSIGSVLGQWFEQRFIGAMLCALGASGLLALAVVLAPQQKAMIQFDMEV